MEYKVGLVEVLKGKLFYTSRATQRYKNFRVLLVGARTLSNVIYWLFVLFGELTRNRGSQKAERTSDEELQIYRKLSESKTLGSQRFKLDDSRDQIHHRSCLLIVTPSYYFIKLGSTILRVVMVKLLIQRVRRLVPFSHKPRGAKGTSTEGIDKKTRTALPSSLAYTEGAKGICTKGFHKKTRTAPRRLASPSSFAHIEGAKGTPTEGIDKKTQTASPSSFVYTEGAEGICTEGFHKKTRTTPRRLASPSSFAHIEGAEGTSTEGIDKKTRTASLSIHHSH
ncbi:hypothetical protein LguiA_007277 [Lonicera macranthoides]